MVSYEHLCNATRYIVPAISYLSIILRYENTFTGVQSIMQSLRTHPLSRGGCMMQRIYPFLKCESSLYGFYMNMCRVIEEKKQIP